MKQALLDFFLVFGLNTEPHISLTVRGLFSTESDVNQLITLDDGDGLQHLISLGGARPNDLSTWDGASALHVSFLRRCL